MSTYVVDTSVAVKWFLPEVHSEAALRLHAPTHQLHLPAFSIVEFGNVLCKKVRRNEVTITESESIFALLHRLPLTIHPDEEFLSLAFDLAHLTQRSLYDCLYLALAIGLTGEMVTADRKFFNALKDGEFGPHLCWVESIPA